MNILMDLDETLCDGQSCLESTHFTRFIVLSRGLRPVTTLIRIKSFLPINHERMEGSWWFLDILLILIRRWVSQGQGHKVKGQGHISLYDCLRWFEIDQNSIDGDGLRWTEMDRLFHQIFLPIYCISRVKKLHIRERLLLWQKWERL